MLAVTKASWRAGKSGQSCVTHWPEWRPGSKPRGRAHQWPVRALHKFSLASALASRHLGTDFMFLMAHSVTLAGWHQDWEMETDKENNESSFWNALQSFFNCFSLKLLLLGRNIMFWQWKSTVQMKLVIQKPELILVICRDACTAERSVKNSDS